MVLENYHHNTEGKGAKGGDSVVEVMDDGVGAGADVQGITGGDEEQKLIQWVKDSSLGGHGFSWYRRSSRSCI